MSNLDKALKVYKDAAKSAKYLSDKPNMDVDEYMALVEIRNGAANDVAKEIMQALDEGKTVHITDIPTLRAVFADMSTLKEVLREVTDGPTA